MKSICESLEYPILVLCWCGWWWGGLLYGGYGAAWFCTLAHLDGYRLNGSSSFFSRSTRQPFRCPSRVDNSCWSAWTGQMFARSWRVVALNVHNYLQKLWPMNCDKRCLPRRSSQALAQKWTDHSFLFPCQKLKKLTTTKTSGKFG